MEMKYVWSKDKDFVIDDKFRIYHKNKLVGIGINLEACLQRIYMLNGGVYVDIKDLEEIK